MMYNYNGNEIYAELQAKLKNEQDLTDNDILNLIFLPLIRNTIPKAELAKKSIELAQTIPDRTKSEACIASTISFAEKYLKDEAELNRIKEVARMTGIFTSLLTDEMIEVAKKAIEKRISINDIADLTKLDIETIKELKEQLEQESEENDE